MQAFVEKRVRELVYVPDDEEILPGDLLDAGSTHALVAIEWLMLAVGGWLVFIDRAPILMDVAFAVLCLLILVTYVELKWPWSTWRWRVRRHAADMRLLGLLPAYWPQGADDPNRTQPMDPQEDIPTQIIGRRQSCGDEPADMVILQTPTSWRGGGPNSFTSLMSQRSHSFDHRAASSSCSRRTLA